MEIGGVSPEGVAVPELGVAPLLDTDTELEDELPTPEVSPLSHDSSLQGVRLPEVCPAPRAIVDAELEKALLSVSILPGMVTPLEEPVEVFRWLRLRIWESSVPVLSNDDPGAQSGVSPLWVTADQPILDLFPYYSISPAGSVYEPVTSPLTSSLLEDADYRPPPSPATMDLYLSSDGDLLLGGAVDLPLLSMPLTPSPVVANMVPESSVGSPAGGYLLCRPQMGCRTYHGRAPLMCIRTRWSRGPLHRCWTVCQGCQYRMASYDDDVDRSDLNPAYGLHLHDPRLFGVCWGARVGVPSQPHTGVLGAPYGRDWAMSAALQQQHDAGLILSNLQVIGQFVTSLNRMSSEVMRVAFAHKPFPTEAVQSMAPSHLVRRAAHYMAAMGLWRPPSTPGVPGPLTLSSCSASMMCSDCSDSSPRGGGGGGMMLTFCFCVHILPPAQTTDIKTFIYIYNDLCGTVYIPVLPLALLCVLNIEI